MSDLKLNDPDPKEITTLQDQGACISPQSKGTWMLSHNGPVALWKAGKHSGTCIDSSAVTNQVQAQASIDFEYYVY